jgi:hypothetical protein
MARTKSFSRAIGTDKCKSNGHGTSTSSGTDSSALAFVTAGNRAEWNLGHETCRPSQLPLNALSRTEGRRGEFRAVQPQLFQRPPGLRYLDSRQFGAAR